MSPADLQCPQPRRLSSLKRHLVLDSFDRDHGLAKRRQPVPAPFVNPGKPRQQPDLPSKKRCLEQPPSLTSLVHTWLSKIPGPPGIPRPNTAPLLSPLSASRRPPDDPLRETRRSKSVPPALGHGVSTPSPGPPPAEIEMPQSSPRAVPSTALTANSKLSTSDAKYREVIFRNNIILDVTGQEIKEDESIQKLVKTRILKSRRASPPLSNQDVMGAVTTAAQILNKAEGRMGDLLATKAFPLKQPGRIEEGCNLQWGTDPLPTNPRYVYRLSAPKPDRHIGYPSGCDFDWTDEEMAAIDAWAALPYTQPTRENVFPFMSFELKSEATGGALYVAENQGVGSGVHMVASLRWILNEAFPVKKLVATDAVAFFGAVSPRLAVFYLVWYSDKKERYIVSKIKTVSFMDDFDIQPCRDLINNIIDYGMGIRLRSIRKALAKLNPIPAHWNKARLASGAADTPSRVETPAPSCIETPTLSSGSKETLSNKRRKT